jgi:hypothetical protein
MQTETTQKTGHDPVEQVADAVKLAGLGVLLVAPYFESVITNFGRPGVGEKPLFQMKPRMSDAGVRR